MSSNVKQEQGKSTAGKEGSPLNVFEGGISSSEDISSLATPTLATPQLSTPAPEDSEDGDNGKGAERERYEVEEKTGIHPQSELKKGKDAKAVKSAGNGKQVDPEALTDAVAAAGVNLRMEEEQAMAGSSGLSVSRKQVHRNHFLKPQQLAWFMARAMEDQGMRTSGFDPELINLMSAACESYMNGLVTDTVLMSRHRRRGVKIRRHQSISGSKSDISRALRDIAIKQKLMEEKRSQRRVALGLDEEKKDEETEEQTQTNLTASLMMSGSMKKRYSWMQTSNSRHTPLGSRGDNGIRYREAREEPGIVTRDVLAAIENRRMGVASTIVKGYAKLRD
ncbi:TAF4 [Brettanomyces bruxellensis]|uniref:Transcription initiation factor TFIID subunit 4 n=1 Tax=Dekkera bruxellensis TaxID=5007 RepID=A0A7D9CWH8_DEKBR|nr:TAF4 [Brettanomyces bruxellensis]